VKRWLFLLLMAWAAAAHAAADTMSGVVIVVIDGDTVLFRPDHYHPSSRAFLKVRLADIDAPEKDQPHGDAATRALQDLVLKQRAELDVVAIDAYGRKVGRLNRGTVSVAAEMVRVGAAWATTRGQGETALEEMQREARGARRGLWQDAAPTPPWVWRREQQARHH
jgi:endonuclease YncB( thermonuclease family)